VRAIVAVSKLWILMPRVPAQAEAERRLARAKQTEPSWGQAPSSSKKRARVEEDDEEDTEMQVSVPLTPD